MLEKCSLHDVLLGRGGGHEVPALKGNKEGLCLRIREFTEENRKFTYTWCGSGWLFLYMKFPEGSCHGINVKFVLNF